MNAAQRQALVEYVEAGDREQEPVFVGRGDLFELIGANARACARGHGAGRTVCLSGPLGIGKTAFLGALPRHVPRIACVTVSSSDLHDPRHVIAPLATLLPDGWKPEPGVTARILAGMPDKFRIGVPGVVSAEFSRAAGEAETNDDDRSFPWRATAELLSAVPADGAVAVLVDEAQGMVDTPGMDANLLLRSLHEGPPRELRRRAPVFAVLAGHTQTPDIIGRSISQRYSRGNERPMKLLSSAESKEYVHGVLDHLELRGCGEYRERVAEWIAGECGGWPHQLRNAMCEVARDALRAGTMDMDRLDGRNVMTGLSAARTEYYAQRLRPDLGRWRRETTELRTALARKPHDEFAMRDAATRIVARRGRAFRRFGEGDPGETADRWTDELVAKGLVARTDCRDDLRYVCPIDNLATYVETGQHHCRRAFPSPGGNT